MRRVLRLLLLAALVIALFAGGWLAGRTGVGSVLDPASLDDAERQFAERMRDVTLVGTFTVAGREDRTPRPDRYDIASVEKIGEDLWRFNAVIGELGGTHVPVAVPMRWVGDTPMILMTDTDLPGIGTFTVRLFFYEDRYAGIWQHGETGGLMAGRIERN
jgi:hypothetical protein